MPKYVDQRAAMRRGAVPSRHDNTVPTEDNTVDEIKEWLDTHGIEYASRETKAELLGRVSDV